MDTYDIYNFGRDYQIKSDSTSEIVKELILTVKGVKIRLLYNSLYSQDEENEHFGHSNGNSFRLIGKFLNQTDWGLYASEDTKKIHIYGLVGHDEAPSEFDGNGLDINLSDIPIRFIQKLREIKANVLGRPHAGGKRYKLKTQKKRR